MILMKIWKCRVCGYEHQGDEPPKECPQCSSSSREFAIKSEKKPLRHDGKKFDVLVINGSMHSSHNSSAIADMVESALREKGASFRRFNLGELEIRHCWCCYSMKDSACTYPCRNQLDDMPALHEMLVDSSAVIIVSPINWNSMPAVLKDFLDRTTCLQNQCLLGKKSMTAGKVVGIIINGHEDGALKTAMDIFAYFQQMGYLLAPFGFAYKTHGAAFNAQTDHDFFAKDEKLKKDISGVVNNVVEMLKQDLEKKLDEKIKYVCE